MIVLVEIAHFMEWEMLLYVGDGMRIDWFMFIIKFDLYALFTILS